MKKISKAIRAVLVAGLLSYGLFCQQANAIPITGSIIFAGPATASGPSGVGTTTISFTNPWTTVTGIGSYSSVTSGTPTTLTAFSFVGTGTTAMLSAPVMPEWTFTFGGNTYSFDLLSLSSGTTTSGSMAISGTGIAHITGFDALNRLLDSTGPFIEKLIIRAVEIAGLIGLVELLLHCRG